MAKEVEMSQLDPEAAGNRFQVARASVDFREPPDSLSPDSRSNSQGRPSIYETKYLRSLRHYLTRDALPRETHYRNLGSIAEGQLRPTIDQLRAEDYVKVSCLKVCEVRGYGREDVSWSIANNQGLRWRDAPIMIYPSPPPDSLREALIIPLTSMQEYCLHASLSRG